MRVRPLLVMLSTLLAVIAGCTSGETLSPLPPGGVVVAFGDSITFGTGAPAGGSYPAVLSGLCGLNVVNCGIPGETSGEGASRLPEVLAKEKPALVIICHGGNDFLRGLPREETAANIRRMLVAARDAGVQALLVAVPVPDLSLSPPPLYREVAAEMHVPLEEKVLTKVLTRRSLKSDPVHPNADGYRMIAERVLAALKSSGGL